MKGGIVLTLNCTGDMFSFTTDCLRESKSVCTQVQVGDEFLGTKRSHRLADLAAD